MSAPQAAGNAADQEISAVFKERHRFRPGERITLAPNLETVHVFDKETGQRVMA